MPIMRIRTKENGGEFQYLRKTRPYENSRNIACKYFRKRTRKFIFSNDEDITSFLFVFIQINDYDRQPVSQQKMETAAKYHCLR